MQPTNQSTQYLAPIYPAQAGQSSFSVDAYPVPGTTKPSDEPTLTRFVSVLFDWNRNASLLLFGRGLLQQAAAFGGLTTELWVIDVGTRQS